MPALAEGLGDGPGAELLGGKLGLGLVGDGLGLGLGLLAGLELVTGGPVVKVAQTVGLGLAVVVAPVAGRADGVARTGCCDAQLAGFGCW